MRDFLSWFVRVKKEGGGLIVSHEVSGFYGLLSAHP